MQICDLPHNVQTQPLTGAMMLNIFDKLAFINKAPNGGYNLNKTTKDKFVFQLGNIATIWKKKSKLRRPCWLDLGPAKVACNFGKS